ncbi:peptide deformylase [Candidatus Saccharibacteria bacterium]|nr:peptide deformylase [Candidatus Saccharibacteria bacterium]
MDIITTPDRRLREKSERVGAINFEVLDTIAKMRKLSMDWEKEHPYELSAAMAAPQMGILKRIIIVRDGDDKEKPEFTALINPVVLKAEGKVVRDYEGCLSVPRIYGMVPRPSKVKVKARLEDGSDVVIKATGELARTLLHEIDHLDGVLFIDHIRDVPDAFYEMNEKGDLVPIPVAEYEKRVRDNAELWGEE